MDTLRAPIESLKKEMGKALDAAIDKQGGKVAFAERAGLNRATLYRLLRGGNVSTDVLLRTLRALGRADLIAALIAPPEPSPLELRPATERRSARRHRAATQGSSTAERQPTPQRSSLTVSPQGTRDPQSPQGLQGNRGPQAGPPSLVNRLALGRLPGESDDG